MPFKSLKKSGKLFNKSAPTMSLRYEFSKETEPELLRFLKVAEELKHSGNCNSEEYEKWSKLLPPDPEQAKNLKGFEELDQSSIIDLCVDKEAPPSKENEEIETNVDQDISDAAFVIKENLQSQNCVVEDVKRQLCKCQAADLEVLFKTLENTLSSEEVYHFGISLTDILTDSLARSLSLYLLVPRIKKEYCEKLFKLLEHFSDKNTTIILDDCSQLLHDLSHEEIPIILRYLKKMNPQFQASLLRTFILSVSKLDDNYLTIIGALLNTEVEYETLSKFIDMLSNVAEDHSSDKDFGKLLMTLVEGLGPNLIHVEQPLKLIISSHTSVWKSKLEKKFTTCYEDSLFLSQSFRY